MSGKPAAAGMSAHLLSTEKRTSATYADRQGYLMFRGPDTDQDAKTAATKRWPPSSSKSVLSQRRQNA
jgi:hypothetical protein